MKQDFGHYLINFLGRKDIKETSKKINLINFFNEITTNELKKVYRHLYNDKNFNFERKVLIDKILEKSNDINIK